MFEDIMTSKEKTQENTNATIIADGKEYEIKIYGVNMTDGTVVGFIKDTTRKIDGCIDYEISIPINATNCEWSFPVMVVRTSPDTLKFYTAEV